MFFYDNNNVDFSFAFSSFNFCFHGNPALATPGQFLHYNYKHSYKIINIKSNMLMF